MTVAATAEIPNYYAGDSVENTFDFTFQVAESSHLTVIVFDAVDQPAVLTETTDYTVTGFNNVNGGSITVLSHAIPATGEVLMIAPMPPVQQLTTLPAAGGFINLRQIERMIDRVVLTIQGRVMEILSRVPTLPFATREPMRYMTFPVPESLSLTNGGRKVVGYTADDSELELIELTTETGLLSSAVSATSFAGLPALGSPHRLRAVTDKSRGLWKENQDSTAWVPVSHTADCREWSIYPGASDLTNKLEQAVTDCCAEGVSLYIPKGTYILPQDFDFAGNATALELLGAGRGHTVLRRGRTDHGDGQRLMAFRNMSGLYLHDMTIDDNGFWGSGSNRQVLSLFGCVHTVVERVEILNAFAIGLNLEQYTPGNILPEYMTIRDCWASNCGNQGFAAVGARNVNFIDCVAHHNRFKGFDLEVNANVGSYVNNCSISFCTAHDNGSDGINVQGIMTYDPDKPAANYGQNAVFTLIGNRCYDNGYVLIPVNEDDPAPSSGLHVVDANGAIVMGNFCRNNNRAGIHIEHGPHPFGNGIHLEDFIITGNVCKSNQEFGILLQGEGADFLQQWIVSNNILRLNGLRGISADNLTRYGFMAGNLITYNTVANTNISSLAFTRGLGREQIAGDVNETARPRLPLPTDNTTVLPFYATGVSAGAVVDMGFAGGVMTRIPFGSSGAAVKLAVRLSSAPTGSTAFTVSLTVDGDVKNFSCVVQGPSATENQVIQEIAVATGTNWGAGQDIGLQVTASAGAPTKDVWATLQVITFPNG